MEILAERSVLIGIVQGAYSCETPSFFVHAEQHVVNLQIQLVELLLHSNAGPDESLDFDVLVFHCEVTGIIRDLYVFRF